MAIVSGVSLAAEPQSASRDSQTLQNEVLPDETPSEPRWQVSTGAARVRFVESQSGPTRRSSAESPSRHGSDTWRISQKPAPKTERSSPLATSHSSDRKVTKAIHRRPTVATVAYEEEVEGPTLARPTLASPTAASPTPPGSTNTGSTRKTSTYDAFENPFGDREPQEDGAAAHEIITRREPQAEQESLVAEPAEIDEAETDDFGPVPPQTLSPEILEVSQESEAVQQTTPRGSLQRQVQPKAPPVDEGAVDEGAPIPPPTNELPSPSDNALSPEDEFGNQEFMPRRDCDRLYNERDCCDEDERCLMSRKNLKSGSIREISLDITPSILPNATSPEEVQRHKATTLASAPSREWKSRAGETVAVGRLRDMKLNRAVVETADGQKKELQFNDLSDDDRCFVAAWWGLPTECLLAVGDAPRRVWTPVEMNWTASALSHKPLYFEEVQLERYGHTPGPFTESIVSGAHFFTSVAFLPYKMAINPPGESQYTLGYYRPGSCAPWLVPPMPLSIRGAAAQAGIVTGGVFVIP